MDDNRGISLVVANTPKGQTLLDELSGQLRIARIDDSLKVKYDATSAKRNRLHDDVRSCLSFRIGRVITWLPRKLTGRK